MNKKLLLIPLAILTYGGILFVNNSLFGLHIILLILILTLFFAHNKTRSIVVDLFPIILYGLVYDLLRFFPNHSFNKIHFTEPYNLEKSLFGFEWLGKIVTPNEYFAQNHTYFLDLLCGFTYLTWIPIPVILMIIWWVKDKAFMQHFIIAFVATNLLGMVGYYLYPAAPPWYIADYGFEWVQSALASPAGHARFDEHLNVSIFHGMYGANPNVYGAIPSLHCANPIIVTYFISKKYGWIAFILGLFYAATMWFSAVYSIHHYIVDAIAGFGVAILGIFISNIIVRKKK